MLRKTFDRELNDLREVVLATASEVEEKILKVTMALLERDAIVAERLIAADQYINERYIKVVMGSFTLIATQQPMPVICGSLPQSSRLWGSRNAFMITSRGLPKRA